MATKSKTTKKRLVVLDSHAIIHRAYHALPDFQSPEGEPTGALYGLAAMLLKIADDLKPDYIVAAYDLPGPTKRHDVFDEYKAGREKTDDDLVHQIERSRDLFKAFGIPIYEKVGFEADDVIGTIVEKLKNRKTVEVVIASGDMDTLQLVSGKKTQVYTLRKGIKDTIVYDEKGVKERFGFGPTLLPDYKGLRGDPSDNIPGVPGIGEKTATALITGFGSIEDIYKKLEKDEKSLEKKGIKPRIINLLKEHEKDARFSKDLAVIRTDAEIAFSLPKNTWQSSVDPQHILTLFQELNFKTLSDRVQKFFGVKEEKKKEEKVEETEDVSDKEIRTLGIALWVLNSEYTNPSLDDILSFSKTGSFAKARDYIFDQLKKQELLKVYGDIEEPLIEVVDEMEARGVRIDLAFLKSLSKKYHTKLDALEHKIHKHAGREFNINSPKQLGEILFDELELSSKARTASGQRSTRESALEKIKDAHPIIEDILSYRELQKLLSTYIDTFPAYVNPSDKRLHANFLQNGTTTGRMSSQRPNLQNIPIRTDLGKVIRNAFIAEKGHKLLALDYSQIELRTAAFMSGDTKMIEVFENNGDIHTAVAEEVFGEANADTRRKAKVINFGILYGMGSTALAKATGSKRTEAQSMLKEYFEDFSGLSDFLENTKAFAHKNGYTETYFGRRRYFPGLASNLPYVRAEAERMAINAPLQGTAADVIKIAMRQVHEYLEKEKLHSKAHLVLQVHDELVYEIKESAIKKIAPEIERIMEGVLSPKETKGVPLSVDAVVGDNWGEMEKL